MTARILILLSVFIIFGTNRVSAQHETISLNLDRVNLKEILKHIEKVDKYSFIYENSIIDKQTRISICLESISIYELMEYLSLRFNIKYKITDNKLILITRLNSKTDLKDIDSEKSNYDQQRYRICGTVKKFDGKPLTGVNLRVNDRFVRTITDRNGIFLIDVIDGDVITFSFIGFQTYRYTCSGDRYIDIRMVEKLIQVKDVVVVAYGRQHSREVTGVVSSMNASKITESNIYESTESLLQGRVAGLNIQQSSGAPGSSPTVIIRGLAAISRDDGSITSEPLYVIDDVPIIARMNSEYAVTSTNVLADLDPNDIEKLSVLKDASAAAIYGSRAANGVILITTKRGKKGPTKISSSVKLGVNIVPELEVVAGGVKERELVQDIYNRYAPEGEELPKSYSDFTNPYWNHSSDWQGYVYNSGVTKNLNLSIRGGNDSGTYSCSLNYMDDIGIKRGSGFRRYSSLLNSSITPKNKKIEVNSTFAFSRTCQDISVTTASSSLSSLLPLPSDIEGSVDLDFGKNYSINDRLRSSIDASLAIKEVIKFRSQLSYEYSRAQHDIWKENREDVSSTFESSLGEYSNLLFESRLTIMPWINRDKTRFSLMIGVSGEKCINENTVVKSLSSHPSTEFGISNSTQYNTGYSDYSASTILSLFSRVNWSYRDKYLFEGSLRMDGSSKFGIDERWGLFPAISGGWLLTEEELIRSIEWINFMKIRASYGISGTNWDPDYLALGVMDGGDTDEYNSMLEITYGGIQGFTPSWDSGFRNYDLTWINTHMWNIGLDLTILNSKTNLTIDIYEKLTEGLLLTTPLPSTSGYNMVYRNAADVVNRGVELSINYSINLGRNSLWVFDINSAFNSNNIVSLPDGNSDIISTGDGGTDFGTIHRVGVPLNSFYLYQENGIYQSESDIEINPSTGYPITGLKQKQLLVGDRRYHDIDQNYQINVSDRVVSGDPNPKWTGGVVNSLTAGAFSFELVTTFLFDRDVINSSLIDRLALTEDFAEKSILDLDNYSIWKEPGDNTKYPSINPWNSVQQITTMDSKYVESGAYFKLKSFTASYSPQHLADMFNIERCNFYCTLDNIYTFQSYSGSDAEVLSLDGYDMSGGYPLRRKIIFGLTLEL